ncbi:MAG: hypothetical protein QOH40_1802, partial [Arthrobacter pascens]|nr:hypothetical protein [Arthrobacter pascens]
FIGAILAAVVHYFISRHDRSLAESITAAVADDTAEPGGTETHIPQAR